MKNFLITLVIVLAGASSSMAQFGSDADAATLPFNPVEIAMDFQDRVDNPAPSNAFVQNFFDQYQVPQSPSGNQTMQQTWIVWATNNPGAIEQYLIRRKQNHDQYFQ